MIEIDLTGKVVLVLGGSRGIGEGIVRMLCRAGAAVVFTHTGNRANRTRIAALLAEIEGEGGRAEDVVLDAMDAAGTAALVRQVVNKHRKFHGLVCNVGKNQVRSVEEISPESWGKNLDLNLTPYARKPGKIVLVRRSISVLRICTLPVGSLAKSNYRIFINIRSDKTLAIY